MATKKVVKRAPAKPAKAAAAPAAAQTQCQCQGGGCGCRCGRFWKKTIVLLLVFLAGFAVCKFCCCCGKKKQFGGHHEFKQMFVNGCLDLSKIDCPAKAQQIASLAATADADANGCITPAELKAAKKMIRDAE